MSDWEVVVGNVGTVYSGPDGFKAKQTYAQYVHTSRTAKGSRAFGEPVTLFKNGDILPGHDYLGKKETPEFSSRTAAMRYIKEQYGKYISVGPTGFGELCVGVRGKPETRYFTTDPTDAVGTARLMYEKVLEQVNAALDQAAQNITRFHVPQQTD
jgi:hypothetical protein